MKLNYEVNRPLPTGKNKKVIGLMKDELGGKILTEFVALRPKTYSYLTDDYKEDKKAKRTKKCVIKRRLKFNDYKYCLLLAIEMKKAKVKMNNPVYLGLSILEISKILMHEFWYYYMKPKYGDNLKLCYMDTDSFIMQIKTEDFYKL